MPTMAMAKEMGTRTQQSSIIRVRPTSPSITGAPRRRPPSAASWPGGSRTPRRRGARRRAASTPARLEARENARREQQGAVGPRRVGEVHGEPARALADDALQRLRHLRRRAGQPDVGHGPDVRRRLEPLDLGGRLGDQDPDADDLHDRVVVALDLATVRLQHLLLVRIELVLPEAVVPPVGVLGDGAQQVFLAVAADHDGRDRLRARLAVRVRDPVVLPRVGRGRLRPHPTDQLDRFGELGDAHGRRRKRPAVGEILLLVPAGADAENRAAARERLRGGDHLGGVRRIAEAVTEDLVAGLLVGITRERPRQERPALGHGVAVVLHVVGQPQRVERSHRLVEVGKRRLDQARPDVEADGNGHLPAATFFSSSRNSASTLVASTPLALALVIQSSTMGAERLRTSATNSASAFTIFTPDFLSCSIPLRSASSHDAPASRAMCSPEIFSIASWSCLGSLFHLSSFMKKPKDEEYIPPGKSVACSSTVSSLKEMMDSSGFLVNICPGPCVNTPSSLTPLYSPTLWKCFQ